MKTSVAFCTYNGEEFIRQQIDSILEQTQPVDEIVVCDDGSTDSTLEILENYKEKFPNIFRIYRNEDNLGSVRNFEKAIELCKHEIVFLSDQDDIWLPEKVQEYCDYLQKHPDIDVIASNGYGIDSKGEILDVYSVWDVPIFFREKKLKVDYFEMIAFSGNIVTGATLGFRKKFISGIVPFPIIKGFHHDEWIGLNAALHKKLHVFEKKYFKYRAHENQQVGGIFFDKTEKQKNMIVRHFDFSMKDNKFVSYKRILKKLVSSKKKNTQLLNAVGYEEVSKQVSEEIAKKFYDIKKEMRSLHPIRTFFLSISDSILNKRQLN